MAVTGRLLIYLHKEAELEDVERHYPTDHYVMVEDKLRLLDAVKKVRGSRVTTAAPPSANQHHIFQKKHHTIANHE